MLAAHQRNSIAGRVKQATARIDAGALLPVLANDDNERTCALTRTSAYVLLTCLLYVRTSIQPLMLQQYQ
jgi:hypothetical protein